MPADILTKWHTASKVRQSLDYMTNKTGRALVQHDLATASSCDIATLDAAIAGLSDAELSYDSNRADATPKQQPLTTCAEQSPTQVGGSVSRQLRGERTSGHRVSDRDVTRK